MLLTSLPVVILAATFYGAAIVSSFTLMPDPSISLPQVTKCESPRHRHDEQPAERERERHPHVRSLIVAHVCFSPTRFVALYVLDVPDQHDLFPLLLHVPRWASPWKRHATARSVDTVRVEGGRGGGRMEVTVAVAVAAVIHA